MLALYHYRSNSDSRTYPLLFGAQMLEINLCLEYFVAQLLLSEFRGQFSSNHFPKCNTHFEPNYVLQLRNQKFTCAEPLREKGISSRGDPELYSPKDWSKISLKIKFHKEPKNLPKSEIICQALHFR